MGQFANKLVVTVEGEHAAYDGKLEHQSPLRERIGQYWAFLGRPDLDGADHEVPWSAAFISFMVNVAGAGAAFPYSPQHSQFVYRAINDRLIKKMTAFHGFRADEVDITPGDIIHMNRSGADVIDYMWASTHRDYPSHADIVVAVEGTKIEAIGGNVGTTPGEIGRKTFKRKDGVWTNGKQTVTTVIRSFLP